LPTVLPVWLYAAFVLLKMYALLWNLLQKHYSKQA